MGRPDSGGEAGRGGSDRAVRGCLPGSVAGRGGRAQPGPADGDELRDVLAAVHSPGSGREAARQAQRPRRAALDERAADPVPVLCPGQGPGSTGAPMLRQGRVLRPDRLGVDPASGVDGAPERSQLGRPRRGRSTQRRRPGAGAGAPPAPSGGVERRGGASVPRQREGGRGSLLRGVRPAAGARAASGRAARPGVGGRRPRRGGGTDRVAAAADRWLTGATRGEDDRVRGHLPLPAICARALEGQLAAQDTWARTRARPGTPRVWS